MVEANGLLGKQRLLERAFERYCALYIFVLIITAENLYFIQASESIKAHLFDHIRSKHWTEWLHYSYYHNI